MRDIADACVLARAVMERSKHALLVGEGAVRFAESVGVGKIRPHTRVDRKGAGQL